ncbi:MAG: histidine kinase dimerization/phospho-acceptor domain-containing protein [Thomasclavelia ramosa]
MAILNEGAMALEKEASNSKNVKLKLKRIKRTTQIYYALFLMICTPLTSISGNAGVLLDSADKLSNERKIEIYSDIYEDSMWLIDLVENLLSITRIENGNIQINKEAQLINEIVLEAMHHISKDSASHYSIGLIR